MIALLAAAALHTAAIPDGPTWWCDDKTCEREHETCGAKCTTQASAWVATAQERTTKRWKRIATPTEATCKAAVAKTFKRDKSVSACATIAASDPVPPDASLIPKGQGWVCYADGIHDLGVQVGGGSPSHCFRTDDDCTRVRYGGSTLIPRHDDTGCFAQKTAWVITTLDGYQAVKSEADCDAARKIAENRTACAELP